MTTRGRQSKPVPALPGGTDAETLFQTHGSWLLNALRRLYGAELAEDLVQETYLRLLRQAQPLTVLHPKAFLLRVARNLFVTQYHQDLRRAQREAVSFGARAQVEAADLAHVQFETIHPFLDGNGRLGRLLVTLLLCEAGLLREPILYLSLFLKARRADYYRLLQEVRETGRWEAWMEFFLTGVAETAEQATETARELTAMFDRDRATIAGFGRSAGSVLRVHELLQKRPITSIVGAARDLRMSVPTAGKALGLLVEAGIVRETTGQRRNRLFVYTDYLAVLDRGTEPLPR